MSKNYQKVTFGNKTFNLDVEQAKKLGVLRDTVPIKVGSYFRNVVTSELYMIAYAPDTKGVFLTCINDGRRWSPNTTNITNADNINDTEFDKITSGGQKDFEQVGLSIAMASLE